MEYLKSPTSSHYINGQWIRQETEDIFSVVNPADEIMICTIPCADGEIIDQAVMAAKESFDDGVGVWPSMSGKERAVVLREIAVAVVANAERLARLETLNSGKPLKESVWDMEDVSGCFEYYAEQAELLDTAQDTEIVTSMQDSFYSKLQYIPVGVVGAIVPWNYPLLMATWKLAPALASGCTVVIKPSELTPLTLLELAEIIHKESSLPNGVLNVVVGDGKTGGLITSHPDVEKIAFTGSVPTGSKVMQAATKRLANVTLELGGKSPLIIFDDVEIDKAVEWALFGCFYTNGQICSATSRVLVQNNIYESFITRLLEVASKIPLINPNDEEFHESAGAIGPLVSSGQLERVNTFIQTARDEEGVTILYGGNRPENKTVGYYIEPTILEVTDPRVTVWNEEIFGPVMSVMKFTSEEEAVKIANTNKYGLAGGVMSADPLICERVGKRLRCGVVWKNCSQPSFVQLPWGGLKQSGIGRELGSQGIYTYLETKSIIEYTSNDPWAWYIPKN